LRRFAGEDPLTSKAFAIDSVVVLGFVALLLLAFSTVDVAAMVSDGVEAVMLDGVEAVILEAVVSCEACPPTLALAFEIVLRFGSVKISRRQLGDPHAYADSAMQMLKVWIGTVQTMHRR
jgi:hypothetical protein